MKRVALLVLILSAVVMIAFKGRKSEVVRLEGQAMGCAWSLAYEGDASADVRRVVAEELELWEQVMSQWRKDSDLSRFNRGEAASAELLRVIALAQTMKVASGSAFDYELLEQVHASGFGPEGKGVDLSGIGKGFAVDRVGERLRSLGVHRFVFELGGEVLAGDGEWKLAIESPLIDGNAEILTVTNRAVATSGNYQQFRETGNGLASHLIDPETGSPVLRPRCSVTVLADDCATADAWATALFVLGPEARPDGAPEFFWSFGDD
ncbi:FAD:protein FMN transferase [Haloferula chungangensis]|uniref:FAD:protein FMN transferase n=1 Tax=Haloferula chungangensis TaxID=1048331 RepID=A0ABW2LCR1_9BACT